MRTLYFFSGTALSVDGERLVSHAAVLLQSELPVLLQNGSEESEILLLQGRPIAEPVVQHGPFVMNTREEIQNAIRDYQRTRFGGWPWTSDGPVHARSEGRLRVILRNLRRTTGGEIVEDPQHQFSTVRGQSIM